jgi:hypothetical protein
MMILPTDASYRQTKQVMQGKATMHDDFVPLADWISATYGARPVNVLYGIDENHHVPVLEICFEHETEKSLFLDSNQFAPDKEKQQAVAVEFARVVHAKKALVPAGAHHVSDSDPGYQTDGLWVIFSAFDRVAKMEINESIPQEAVDALQKDLADERLWCVSRMFASVTFFTFTDQEKDACETDGSKERWTQAYFTLLKKYDTFGYFREDDFFIYLDSKENFDTNFGGDWLYYYK